MHLSPRRDIVTTNFFIAIEMAPITPEISTPGRDNSTITYGTRSSKRKVDETVTSIAPDSQPSTKKARLSPSPVESDSSPEELVATNNATAPPLSGRGRGTRGRGGRGGRGFRGGRGGRGGRSSTATPVIQSSQSNAVASRKAAVRGRGRGRARRNGENPRIQALLDRKSDLKRHFKAVALLHRDALGQIREKALAMTKSDPNFHKTLPQYGMIQEELKKRHEDVTIDYEVEHNLKIGYAQRQKAMDDAYVNQQFHVSQLILFTDPVLTSIIG